VAFESSSGGSGVVFQLDRPESFDHAFCVEYVLVSFLDVDGTYLDGTSMTGLHRCIGESASGSSAQVVRVAFRDKVDETRLVSIGYEIGYRWVGTRYSGKTSILVGSCPVVQR
jgi:hypothetical protein